MSYLNTKPLLYGIRHHPVSAQIDLVEDYPSKIAELLIDDKVDMGLIPVTAVKRLNSWNVVSNYCIGSNGPVASVCLFSEVSIEKIEEVYLDYQSQTSVALAKILLHEYWKKKPRFINATGDDFPNQIKDKTAGVVIGDRALEQRKKSSFVYDLGEAWKQHTGLPFVFAAWIANKEVPTDFIRQFNEANALGLQHIDDVIAENPFTPFDLKEYYTKCISYELNEEKKKGLQLFLEKLKNQQ